MLTPGTTLGPYEIVGSLGSGGMGEVYRARDTRLGRTVALKVVSADWRDRPDLRARFKVEAEAIAALSHPHICPLFDVGQDGDIDFLVMEYVEGETLAARLARGRLPVAQALDYARALADALGHAHRRRIVHRDVKPANVMLTKDGLKLLDFGLARVMERAAVTVAGTSTAAADRGPLTQPGDALGTWQYMAPEQLRVGAVDARTDVFALGAVIYEMLTGRRAFDGATHHELVSAILTGDPPDLIALNPSVAPGVAAIVRSALAKEPDDRWQDARDMTRAFDAVVVPDAPGVRPSVGRPSVRGASRYERLGWTAALVLAALLAALGTVQWVRAGSSARDPVVHARIPLTPGDPLGVGARLALSSDGRHLVYDPGPWDDGGPSSKRRLYIRQLDQPNWMPVRGTEGGCCPLFSPSGDLGFVSRDHQLQTVALNGGTPVTIADLRQDVGGAAWAHDGTIVFAPAASDGLWKIAADGGEPRRLTTQRIDRGERTHRWPTMLPDGRSALLTVGTADMQSFDDARIEVVALDSGERRTLIEGGMHGSYAATGHLLYARSGALLAVPFDVKRLEVTGPPLEVVSDAFTDPLSGYAAFATSRSGLLVYAPGGDAGRHWDATLVWVDRQGRATPASAIRRPYGEGRLSPDGSRLALVIVEANVEIWVLDLARDALTRLAYGWTNNNPVWTKDGESLLFTSNRDGSNRIYRQVADGSRPAEPVVMSSGMSHGSLSPDGQTLVFAANRAESGSDILMVHLKDGASPQPLLHSRHSEGHPELSPDGRWLAYISNESGRHELYVQSFPELGRKVQVSTTGGLRPRWTRGGRELVYLSGRQMLSVAVESLPAFQLGKPRAVFEGETWGFDVTPDGERFVMFRASEPPKIAELAVVFNWQDMLTGSVPTR